MYRILSIDGGGIKGVFPASFLATVEDALGDRVANYFDLIVGTSTGGIIALGLGLGLSATEILSFYEALGPDVFQGNFFLKSLRHFVSTKYDRERLRKALENKFGSRTLGESSKRLVIPSMCLETGEAYLYKTSHHPRLERDYKERVVDVALATAAAPSYFPTHRSNSGLPLIDGGVWANNPTINAVFEATIVLEWPRESLRVLSLGCTTTPLCVENGRWQAWGKLRWVQNSVDVFMSGQSSSSLGMAQLFIGSENLLRISPMVPKGRFSIDGIKEIPSLKGLGDAEARKALPKLRRMFLNGYAQPFLPYHCKSLEEVINI